MYVQLHCHLLLLRSCVFGILILLTLPGLMHCQLACHEVGRLFRDKNEPNNCTCPDQTSESFYYSCSQSNESCFRCLAPDHVISGKSVCDNIIDCRDFSDEKFCTFHALDKSIHFSDDKDNGIGDEHSAVDSSVTADNCFCQTSNSSKYILTCGEAQDIITSLPSNTSKIFPDFAEKMCDCPYQICRSTNDRNVTCGCYNNTYDPTLAYFNKRIEIIIIGYLIGITAIVGNAAVIVVMVRDIRRKRVRFAREEKLTKLYFLSLSISDMIVAVSTVIVCTLLRDIQRTRHYQSYTTSCDVVGAMIVIGSEQSIFTMVLITMSRIWGVARPFSRIPVKTFMILLVVSWVLSVVLAVIPLMEIFEDIFVTAIVQNEAPIFRIICVRNARRFVQLTKQYYDIGGNYSSMVSGTWANVRYLLRTLFNVKNTHSLNYYRGLYSCIIDILSIESSNSRPYSMMLYAVNFICFIFILFGYTVIYLKRPRSKNNKVLKQDAQKLKRKIFLVLLTDFACWIPVCIYGMYSAICSFKNENYAQDLGWNYAHDLSTTAILIVLPLNSALNPFIYSAAPEYLHQRIVTFFRWLKGNFPSEHINDAQDDTCAEAGL